MTRAHVVELSLLIFAQFGDLFVRLLRLSHEGAYASILALFSVLDGPIVAFFTATLELGGAQRFILEGRLGSLT